MANGKNKKSDIFSANDPLDINELASLNDDISAEFIEQLQNQVAQNASIFVGSSVPEANDDAALFEEPPVVEDEPEQKPSFDSSLDDNFIKKYKAKINKQQMPVEEKLEESIPVEPPVQEVKEPEVIKKEEVKLEIKNVSEETSSKEKIENLTSGNIVEKPIDQEQIDYNESLDFLDNNVKYSKYVIYIDPENAEFMESLTVKERKNLINRIIREQDDIALTKRRLGLVQTIIKHTIVAIVTVSIAIPVVYWTINASLEASINNYRRSQSIFKTLYREKGKIKTQTNKY